MLVRDLLPSLSVFCLPGLEAALRPPESLINAASLGSDRPSAFRREPPPRGSQTELVAHVGGVLSSLTPRKALLAASPHGPVNPAPPDGGVLRRDATVWQIANGGSLDDAALVKILAEQIRVALWRALAEGEVTEVSRSLAAGGKVVVNISQKKGRPDDDLREYDVTLFSGPAPYIKVHQALWTLDLRTGSLEPIPYGGHEAYRWRVENAGTDPGHHFGPFYAKIRFQSSALTAAPLVQALKPERLEQLRCLPPRPAAAPSPRPQPAAPKTELTAVARPSAVVLHYEAVRKALMGEVIAYAQGLGLSGDATHYLISLADAILRRLHRKETKDPAFGRKPTLHVWIRDFTVLPTEASVEVDSPIRFFEKPRGRNDVLIVLLRTDPSPIKQPGFRPSLELQGDITAADRMYATAFLRMLGLLEHQLNLVLFLDSLHPDFKSTDRSLI